MSGHSIPQSSCAGFLQGAWSITHHNGHQIAFRLPVLSLRQTIYVDGQKIFGGLVANMKKVHAFSIAGQPYSIKTSMPKRQGGAVRCDFYAGETLIDRTTLTFKLGILRIAMVVAAVIGMSAARDIYDWDLSKWKLLGLVMVMLVPFVLMPLPGGGLRIKHSPPQQDG